MACISVIQSHTLYFGLLQRANSTSTTHSNGAFIMEVPQGIPIEVVYRSQTLQAAVRFDRRRTLELRKENLYDPSTATYLVEPDESVCSLRAAELTIVVAEMKNSYQQIMGTNLGNLPWYSNFMPFDIMLGDTNESMVRLGLFACVVNDRRVFVLVHVNNEHGQQPIGDISNGWMPVEENGYVVAHRRPGPTASLDIRNIQELNYSPDALLGIVISNSFLENRKIV